MGEESLWSLLGLFFVAVLVPVAAYYVTRYIARKAKGPAGGPGMKQLERMYLGRDKYILLVKIGGKGYILGVTNQSITSVGTLGEEEMRSYEAQEPAENSGGGFAQKLRSFMNAPETLRQNREQYRRTSGGSFEEPDQNMLWRDADSGAEADRPNGDGQ
jgi:flagellar protein FliO/FliZ